MLDKSTCEPADSCECSEIAAIKSLKSNLLGIDYRNLRDSLNLTQEQFWGTLSVTQSAGSRYESARTVPPKQIAEMVRLTYIEHIDTSKLSGDDVAVALFLKETDPEQFKQLCKKARQK